MDGGISTLRHREPPAKDILAALDMLLACDGLRLSERNRRFLSFVVTQTVAGRAERIKAYSIGVDVFGRDETFDPSVDPIVRIEATRLRSALTAYYEEMGVIDRIRIAIPPGSYVPTFAWGTAPAATRSRPSNSAPALFEHQVAIVLNDLTGQAEPETALRGELFADALVQRLSAAHFKIFVVPPAERRAAASAIQELFAHPGETYSLDVAVRPMSVKRRYSWRFSDLRNSEIVSCDFRDYAIGTTPCFDLIDDLADFASAAITAALAAR